MFSIIIPNYNRAAIIYKSIKSVLDQTYTDFEIIVVDDCSTDDSLEQISKIKDRRLKVYNLKTNSGPAAARNFGIFKSEGEFISFLDSDDMYEKNFLEKTLESLRNAGENVGFSWTGVRYHKDEKEKEYIWIPDSKKEPYKTFLHSLHIGTSSGVTVKKEVFNTCGAFREDLPAAEDTEFFLRITKKFDFTIIPEILVNIYKDGSDRLSKDFNKIARAYNIFLPEHYEEIDSETSLQIKHYYKMMWLNYHLKDKRKAREFYFRIPGSILQKDKFKAFITKSLYEFLPLRKASAYHQKLSV